MSSDSIHLTPYRVPPLTPVPLEPALHAAQGAVPHADHRASDAPEVEASQPHSVASLTSIQPDTPEHQMLKNLVAEANNQLYSANRALRFEIHQETQDLIVRVLNTKTNEVIRQHPSEELLARRERILSGDLGFFTTEIF